MLVPLKPMEDTRVELCALVPDDERVVMQPLVFQALLVFPSSVAEDRTLDVFERRQRAAPGYGGLSGAAGTSSTSGDSAGRCDLTLAACSGQLRGAFDGLPIMGWHGGLVDLASNPPCGG